MHCGNRDFLSVFKGGNRGNMTGSSEDVEGLGRWWCINVVGYGH